MAKYVLAFDIYGTLLDTSSISRALSDHLSLDEDKTSQVSSLWRRYQLEYTWRLNSMNKYEPFDVVTQKSLRHALKESNIHFNEDVIKKLMDAYNILPSFPDAATALEKLANNSDIRVIIFSNGTQSMVRSALDAASLSPLTPEMYVADSVQRFKPTPDIYNALLKHVGKASHPEECFLVSGNPFDVTGALSQRMRAIWVDRPQNGWVDGLLPLHGGDDGMERMKIVHSLNEIPGLFESLR